MTSDSDTGNRRVPPLNLTDDEADALWEMVKVGIGDEEVYAEHQDVIESVHTKVKRVVEGDDAE